MYGKIAVSVWLSCLLLLLLLLLNDIYMCRFYECFGVLCFVFLLFFRSIAPIGVIVPCAFCIIIRVCVRRVYYRVRRGEERLAYVCTYIQLVEWSLTVSILSP